MKNLFYTLIIALLVLSCSSNKEAESYTINGTAKGIPNGIKVYLKTVDERGAQVDKDTAIVMNESFTFKGNSATPELTVLVVTNAQGNRPFIIENGTLDIEVHKDSMHTTKVTGTPANRDLDAFNKGAMVVAKQRQELSQSLRQASIAKDTVTYNQLSKEINDLNIKMGNYPVEFLKNNAEQSSFALLLINNILPRRTDLSKDLISIFNGLDNKLKSSTLGKRIEEQIEIVNKELERIAHLDIGKKAPNFSGPNPEGKTINLNAIKGKVTIIDFWASWCGPCRKENPNVVKVYKKYHDKGLEIIGVSLDRKDQKDKWIAAIEKDQLDWHHISNLEYFNDPIAKLYNITAIPATFILDEKGNIVAKNLRGPALEAKIAELLD